MLLDVAAAMPRVSLQIGCAFLVAAASFDSVYAQPPNRAENSTVDAVTTASLTAEAPRITPAEFEGPGRIVRCPSTITAACMAGGGRYLLLHLKEINKIAVFDISESRIAKFLPAPAGDFSFAGGLTAAVVLDKEKHQLSRWSLVDMKLEATVPAAEDIDRVVMGCSSRGPVYALEKDFSGWNVGFLALDTLKPMPVETLNGRTYNSRMDIECYPGVQVAADGSVLVGIRESFDSGTLVRYAGGRVLQQRLRLHSRTPRKGVLAPLANGQGFIGNTGCFGRDFTPIKINRNTQRVMAAAAPVGSFFLSIASSGNSIHRGADAQLVALAPDLPFAPDTNAYGKAELRHEDRVYFVPAAKVIVVLPAAGSDIALRRMDLASEVETEKAVVCFASIPPLMASRKGFRYKVQTAGAAKPQLTLVVKPPGMTIDENGVINWRPPRTGGAMTVRVVVRASAPGNTAFQKFKLQVEAGESWPNAFRIWRESDSGKTVEARITGFDRGLVQLTRRDGRKFSASLARFDNEDQAFVSGLLEPYPEALPADEPPAPD